VKKRDNSIDKASIRASLPVFSFPDSPFSKTRRGLKSKKEREMEAISTFQTTTATTTGTFFLFFSLFLRSSSTFDMEHCSHRSDQTFHKETYRVQSRFDSRINKGSCVRCARKVGFGVQFGQ
jgi:hypothetical protein